MSEITTNDAERNRGGRFVFGGKPGPGRPKGSRNKLSEAFLEDVHASWERDGAAVLERVAKEDPSAYLRALVMLMPRDFRIDTTITNLDTARTLEAFRAAVSMLNNPPPRALPRAKVIDAA